MECLDLLVKMKNGTKIKVIYDLDYDYSYVIKNNVTIKITDLKNMIARIFLNIDCYEVDYIEFINETMKENYYNEIIECIESDYYKEDFEIWKDLFHEYNEKVWKEFEEELWKE